MVTYENNNKTYDFGRIKIDYNEEKKNAIKNAKLSFDISPTFDAVRNKTKLSMNIKGTFYNGATKHFNFNYSIINNDRKPYARVSSSFKFMQNNEKVLTLKKEVFDPDNDTVTSYFIVDGKRINGDVVKIHFYTSLPVVQLYIADPYWHETYRVHYAIDGIRN